MLLTKVVLVWLGLVLCAIANGALRENLLNQLLGETVSLPISGITLSALIFSITYLLIGVFDSQSKAFYIFTGLSWVVLTLAFEYGFGHYIQGKSWLEISQIFNLNSGNLFILVMIVTALAPLMSALLKGKT